jgi:hypothetical protein
MEGFTGRWKGLPTLLACPVETGVPEETLDRIAEPIDWGTWPRRWRSARCCWKARRFG